MSKKFWKTQSPRPKSECCVDCDVHTPTCHATCERYLKEYASHREWEENRRVARAVCEFRTDVYNNSVKDGFRACKNLRKK